MRARTKASTVTASRPQKPGLTSWDRAKVLPQPAKSILRAARRILRKRGFTALTLQAVAEEAGMKKPAVAYYFGNKAGLVAALVDSVNRTQLERFEREARSFGAATARVKAYLNVAKRLAYDTGMEFFEVLPVAKRYPQVRASLRDLYDRYREMNVANLACGLDEETANTFTALATLTSAVTDGLAIQAALKIDESIVTEAFEEWTRLVLRARADASGEPQEPQQGCAGAPEPVKPNETVVAGI